MPVLTTTTQPAADDRRWISAGTWTCSHCPAEGWGDRAGLNEHLRTHHTGSQQ